MVHEQPVVLDKVLAEAVKALDYFLDTTQAELVVDNHLLAYAVNFPENCPDLLDFGIDTPHFSDTTIVVPQHNMPVCVHGYGLFALIAFYARHQHQRPTSLGFDDVSDHRRTLAQQMD